MNKPLLDDSMTQFHQENGATLAPDGIPLHYGDIQTEYQSGLHKAILLDRSHEGRIRLTGKDRLEILNRMSTNDIVNLTPGEHRGTVFTTPNARILQQVDVFGRSDEILLVTQPGQGVNVANYLSKNIFFNDHVQLTNLESESVQIDLHGKTADDIVANLFPGETLHAANEVKISDIPVFLGKRKSLSGSHWMFVTTREKAAQVFTALLEAGQPYGLRPSGGIVYNALRIRAGVPAGRELSGDYLPLEVGLWDEISFTKGCYTGQEIIARMESRGKLAKTLVKLQLSAFIEAPTDVFAEGKPVGKLTSSVMAPDGEIYALGVIKTNVVASQTTLTAGTEGIQAEIGELAGSQLPYMFQQAQDS